MTRPDPQSVFFWSATGSNFAFGRWPIRNSDDTPSVLYEISGV